MAKETGKIINMNMSVSKLLADCLIDWLIDEWWAEDIWTACANLQISGQRIEPAPNTHVLEEPKKNTNHNPPPRRTTSDDGMGSQEPWKRSGAKEHKRKANNIKKHQKSKEIKSTQDSTFRDRIFLAHKTSSSVASKASVTTPKKGKLQRLAALHWP